MKLKLEREGFASWTPGLPPDCRDRLRESVFEAGRAGTRCLLDAPEVRAAAGALLRQLVAGGVLPPGAVAVQAIAFDKSPAANWKVTWHQDLMFPFARRPRSDGFAAPCVKDGVDYARPPLPILEALLAVRLHLDDCDAENGPLRVVPRTHALGIIPSTEITGRVEAGLPEVCLAREGEVLLLRPLLLHASSPALRPRRRRVLHLVFHSGAAVPEAWHRTLWS